MSSNEEKYHEVNFDGLVGPTHNYAGLSYGNIASARNKGRVSNPKMAALQGLAKMKRLADLGIRQAVLAPQERPDMAALRALGFTGTDGQVLKAAAEGAPQLLAACCSASAMWTANAATVSPSADTRDGRVHFTPANLLSQFHRSLEAETTGRILRAIFPDEAMFAHHAPLPAATTLADEGAANHIRLTGADGENGVECFVYGRSALAAGEDGPGKFPARQTREASEAVARRHGLKDPAVFIRQHSAAIDAGAFHNDVVAVANRNVLLYHEQAWKDSAGALRAMRRALKKHGEELVEIEVKAKQIALEDAVRSYLFNSQIVSRQDGSMVMIAPADCRKVAGARRFLEELPGMRTPIKAVEYVDVRQSMRNGGGPACLRLRVVLNERELAATKAGIFLTGRLYDQLTGWVKRHYRDRLSVVDLADPKLVEEGRRGLDELSGLLGVGAIYEFQRE
jgi:succinylarginine dihydrolase